VTQARRLALGVVGILVVLVGGAAATEREGNAVAIAVVVGRGSRVREISKDDLREIYLRRRRVWSDGERVIPINLPADDPLRERFSRLVLGRAPDDLVSYWNARYFEGVMPPTVLSSSAAIRGYLAVEPRAIAYLPLPDVEAPCRVLLILDR
jgi:hypothetical protein